MPNTEDRQIITEARESTSDLIGNTPGWLLRSGITMVGIVVFTVLVGANFLKYPDKLTSVGFLTSKNPPIEIISQANGYIESIEVEDNQIVKKGDKLVYINNTTNQSEIDVFEVWLVKYEKVKNPKHYLKLGFPKGLQLGMLQNDYAQFQLKFEELQQVLKNGIVFQQINNINREIGKIKTLNQSLDNEKKYYHDELDLSIKDNGRQRALNSSGVISDLDFEKSQTSLLQKQRQYESMKKGIIQNNIRMEQLSLEMLKLKGQRAETIKKYQFGLSEISSKLKSNVQQWTNKYAIEAPITGKITYSANFTNKMPVKQGQTIGHIMPNDTTENFISATYPIGNIGKIEKGQKVIIKFDAFPYKEFGIVQSSVHSIGLLPELSKENVSNYEIKIPVSRQIISDYGHVIPYKPNMTAQIEIITKDQSILERIFDQFLSLVRNV